MWPSRCSLFAEQGAHVFFVNDHSCSFPFLSRSVYSKSMLYISCIKNYYLLVYYTTFDFDWILSVYSLSFKTIQIQTEERQNIIYFGFIAVVI